jgi:hypothetical protein
MRLIAQIPGWSLYDRDAGSNGWTSLKLEAPGRRPKRSWWLGFNGGRLARNHDAALLERHQPDIYAWVLRTLAALTEAGLLCGCGGASTVTTIVQIRGRVVRL